MVQLPDARRACAAQSRVVLMLQRRAFASIAPGALGRRFVVGSVSVHSPSGTAPRGAVRVGEPRAGARQVTESKAQVEARAWRSAAPPAAPRAADAPRHGGERAPHPDDVLPVRPPWRKEARAHGCVSPIAGNQGR